MSIYTGDGQGHAAARLRFCARGASATRSARRANRTSSIRARSRRSWSISGWTPRRSPAALSARRHRGYARHRGRRCAVNFGERRPDAGRGRHQSWTRSSSSRRKRRRRRTSARSSLRWRRISASSSSNLPTACTTCVRSTSSPRSASRRWRARRWTSTRPLRAGWVFRRSSASWKTYA